MCFHSDPVHNDACVVTGHLFVANADVSAVTCDYWLVPCSDDNLDGSWLKDGASKGTLPLWLDGSPTKGGSTFKMPPGDNPTFEAERHGHFARIKGVEFASGEPVLCTVEHLDRRQSAVSVRPLERCS